MTFYIKHNFYTEPNKDNSCLVENKNNHDLVYTYLEIPDKLIYEYWTIKLINNPDSGPYLEIDYSKYEHILTILKTIKKLESDNFDKDKTIRFLKGKLNKLKF